MRVRFAGPLTFLRPEPARAPPRPDPRARRGKDLIVQSPMQLLIQLPIEIRAEGPPDGESYLEMFAAPRQRTAPSTQRLRCVWTYQDRSLEKD